MLKGMVPLKESRQGTRSKAIVGLSFVLLVLLGCGFFLSSLVTRHSSAHAATRHADTSLSKTWYLAEGRVGGGFREFLTIGNPDPVTDCTATITYMPEGDITDAQAKTHQAARKPLAVRTVTIAHSSRYTASVNQDVSVPEQQQPGTLLSAVVTVPATTGCAGVVVERPMYFNYHGVTSGSDVLGTTTLGQSFFLADVPTKAGNSSFATSYLTVLNPSTTTNAFVTVTYYAAGQALSAQTLYVAPGARGTIYPGTLPFAHVAASISVNIPVAVERSTYTQNMTEGNAGVVSTAASVNAAQTLSDHWLFAEGYTGGQYQENLVLSNLTNAPTTATITLEYQNGHNQAVAVPVPADSQVIENINTLNTTPTGTCDVNPCATTPEVSADVTATSASLVVERQMFFHYTHTLPNTSINVTTTGGSDVIGGLVAATSVARFAEGYTNAGYNEWITLQNPTMANETLTLTLVNEYGRTYTENILVTAKTRQTVDITDKVRSNMVQAGDDFRAYQISATVQVTTPGDTFVAERPMYFHTQQNNQGGTDVVGFTGVTSTLPVGTITNFPILTNGVNPLDIVAGPDGNLWFTEHTGNKIGVMTPAGLLIAEYAIPTVGGEPNGITMGPDGNLWFAEGPGGNKIGMITPAGVITEYSTGLTANSTPAAITVGADGNLWFTEYSVGKIGRITPAGMITEYTGTLASNSKPSDIVAGPDGNLWFTEQTGNKIGSITTAGVITEYSVPTGSSTPDGITAGPDGNLWFTEQDGNKIGSITPTGTVTEYSTGLTGSSTPSDITAGPDGNLWFTELSGTKIGKITTAGVISEYTNGLVASGQPNGITAGPDGNLWFTETAANVIGRMVLGGSTPVCGSNTHRNC